MYRIIFLLILLILPHTVQSQADEEKIIAKIGSEVITESEFIERYELTPQINAGIISAEESIKREVLYSIIAEKLWALEAESMGLDNSELIKSTYKAIEKMYVRDALYRQEILSKVKLSDEYLIEAFRRNSLLLDLNYIFSEDETEINNIFKQLGEGVEFYSIFLKRPESTLQETPMWLVMDRWIKMLRIFYTILSWENLRDRLKLRMDGIYSGCCPLNKK